MWFSRKVVLFGLLVVLSLSASACNIGVERNEDGTWAITATSTEAEVGRLLADAITHEQVQNVAVQFHDGYMTASAEFTNITGTHVDTVSFRIDAGVKDQHLDLVLSDVVWNGDPAQADKVAEWNRNLAAALEQAGQRNPNSWLVSVTITDAEMTMVWHAEGRRANR